jgi:hypothetical protein
MALVYASGFEEFGTATQIQQNFFAANADATTVNATGRKGGRAMEVNQTNDRANFPVPERAQYAVAVAFYHDGATLPANDLVSFYEDAIEHITVRVTAAGEVAIDRGSTQLEITSGLGLVGDTWYLLQIDVTINDTTGSYAVDIGDGVTTPTEELAGTSQDTNNGGTSVINRIRFRGASLAMFYDDLVIFDNTGSDLTDFPSTGKGLIVESVSPNGNGNRNNFTRVGGGSNNYEAVDDGTTPDDDTTYNHSSTVDDDELYTFPAAANAVDTMLAVGIVARCRRNAAGPRAARCLIRQNAVEAEGDSLGVSSGYKYHRHFFENNPDGAVDWTQSTAEAAECGVTIEN